MLNKEDELDLLKQVVSLEVMQGQNMLMLKEIRTDLKALTLEYRNYRQSMDTRLNNLEGFQNRFEKSNIEDRLKELERLRVQIRSGWLMIVFFFGAVYTIFSDDIKKLFHV